MSTRGADLEISVAGAAGGALPSAVWPSRASGHAIDHLDSTARRWALRTKSAFDRCAAVILLLALVPALVAIAVAVKLSSPGPVLYRQTRVGRHGRLFELVKFRTMATDADDRLVDLRDRNDCDRVLFKLRDDPRVTSVGRWLRRFSLDEIPQLWHVATGTMSIVGPRPALPSEALEWDAAAARRLEVRPGLTGLWQVSGRSDLPWATAIELDLRYVDDWRLALDAQILARTIPAVLSGRGAY